MAERSSLRSRGKRDVRDGNLPMGGRCDLNSDKMSDKPDSWIAMMESALSDASRMQQVAPFGPRI